MIVFSLKKKCNIPEQRENKLTPAYIRYVKLFFFFLFFSRTTQNDIMILNDA